MSRLAPTDWRTLVRVFEADGFTRDRTTGSHVVLSKPGIARPFVTIPKVAPRMRASRACASTVLPGPRQPSSRSALKSRSPKWQP